MATIKPIEGRSIHQIQSGQVIVDLNSVVKELVENSLDAGATSIGKSRTTLSVDVDNGHGISPNDYETIALKHYTSKLSTYNDLSSLQTFGFRGEALSSLCALSNFHILTARASDGPKGTRLDFETSGKLKGTSVAASQKGTTVAVENLFYNLPVRRRELEKNLKREYGKVLGLLHAYACISVGVRFAVSNQPTKGKKMVVFSTKANPTTRENIANVYGAKTLLALIPLDLKLEMTPTTVGTQSAKSWSTQDDLQSKEVRIEGHISRPVVGEVSKAINEVYKSYNVTQSPFIFANLVMDTNAYDVNVSPDKRTILLHDQMALLEALKEALIALFEEHDQSVPQAQLGVKKLGQFKPLSLSRQQSTARESENREDAPDPRSEADDSNAGSSSPRTHQNDSASASLIQQFVGRDATSRSQLPPVDQTRRKSGETSKDKQALAQFLAKGNEGPEPQPQEDADDMQLDSSPPRTPVLPRAVQDFNDRIASQEAKSRHKQLQELSPERVNDEEQEPSIAVIRTSSQKSNPGPVQNAFDRMRDKTTTMKIGTPEAKRRRIHTPKHAPGTQVDEENDEISDDASNGEEQEKQNDSESEEAQNSSSPEGAQESESDAEMAEPGDDAEDEDAEEAVGDQDEDEDEEYLDEDEKKAREDARVAEIIAKAEENAARPTQDNIKRANNILKGSLKKTSTLQLIQHLETSVSRIEQTLSHLTEQLEACAKVADGDASDFGRMRIIGQFNLGFILAPTSAPAPSAISNADELFIIDQHASDEKINFERLSNTTILAPQRLVHPHPLDLTAIEEEIILSHPSAFAANGFMLTTDTSGDSPVGRRCRLLGLPVSKETTFAVSDLEELIALLNESSLSPEKENSIPRPGKMGRVVAEMGEIDKPWNCPHGRPTMRHLATLGDWEGWTEGDGVVGLGEVKKEKGTAWGAFMKGERKGV
ncbi:DNA mismatch repair protein [Lasiodiplodia theobromae]|uniref:DNA mismatch repair protein n=1 Tax=Lasiodiplodia theobromae TaxID=45133 RepID=UPI0015C32519|nr:DNA mismatch repair protein [Lasiodiplodia theobromae]KAF4538001.1 DNA mismatch repair protein [Lasiodiplodia theobromae]